jgi:glycosyltransferase involved in cell wall biosynthesis
MPRISVICAAYNGAAFLPATLDALKRQTESDFEAILVDDASTDGTPALLASIDDARFRTLRNATNQHVVQSRNRAIESARAAYIAVTDQDDVSRAPRLKHQADMLDRHPRASAVYSLIQEVDEAGRPIRVTADWRYSGEAARAALLFHNFVTHSTLMFRRDCAPDPVYPADYPLCEDYNLIAHLADQGEGLLLVNERLLDYRNHATNHTRAGMDQMTALSRQLRRRLLSRLGLAPTDAEMNLHDAFEAGIDEPQPRLMRQLRDWTEHLQAANERSGAISAASFRRVLSNEWLELSHKFARLGREAWQIYSAGPRSVSPGQALSVLSLWVKTHR